MAYAYAHLNDPRHTGSGIAPHVLIAPISWLTAIAKPIPSSTPGSEVTIATAHTFKAGGYGWLRYLLSPEKNSYTAEAIGDKGHQKFNHSAKIFIPGSYDEVHEQLKLLKNVPLLALVKDADCDAALYYQLGNGCMSAWLTTQFMTGTTVEGVKGYETEITFQSEFVQLYTAATPMAAPMMANVQGLIAANSGQSWELAWDELEGAAGYEVVVSRYPDLSNPAEVYNMLGGDNTTLTDAWSALPAGSKYYFGVRGYTADGSQRPGYPAVAMLTRPAPIPTLPAPTDFEVSTVGTNNANVQCAYDEDGDATTMRTEVYTTADFSGSPVFTLEEGLSSFGLYNVFIFGGGITSGTQYYVRFRLQAAGFTPSPWLTGSFTTTP